MYIAETLRYFTKSYAQLCTENVNQLYCDGVSICKYFFVKDAGSTTPSPPPFAQDIKTLYLKTNESSFFFVLAGFVENRFDKIHFKQKLYTQALTRTLKCKG